MLLLRDNSYVCRKENNVVSSNVFCLIRNKQALTILISSVQLNV